MVVIDLLLLLILTNGAVDHQTVTWLFSAWWPWWWPPCLSWSSLQPSWLPPPGRPSMATVARFEDVLLSSKTSKSTKHVSNISYQIMTTQADQFKTAPYTSLNIKGSHLIRWSSSNPPGSCFLSSWSPWFTWAPSLAAFYQGNTVLKMFLIKRQVCFFPLCSIKDIQARPEDGGVWDWIASCSCASAGFQRNQLNVKMISNTYT